MRVWILTVLLAITGAAPALAIAAEEAPPDPAQVMAIPPELRDALRSAVTDRSRSPETRLSLLMAFLFKGDGGLGMIYDHAATPPR